MKILAIHRFYWPDTPPYASMLRSIVNRWIEDSHEVDVLSSQPSYKSGSENISQARHEVIDGANVVRLSLPSEAGRPFVRIWNAVCLGFSILWSAVVKNKYDVIMVSTSPPVLAGFFAALASKLSGARFIYHCMDVHPEIGRISGEFRNRWIFSLLFKMDQWTCAQANPVIVLSDDMSEALKERSKNKSIGTKVLNNFSLPSKKGRAINLPFSWPEASFVILFAGNIGRFQGLDVLIEAMAGLHDRKDIALIMMGDGVERVRLEKRVEADGANVFFVGHHDVVYAKLAMRKADVGFVSLIPQLYKYAYPSKTMTYLEQGCPVLVSAEPESCLVKDIVRNEVGVAVNGGVQDLIHSISTLSENLDKVEAMRKKAILFGVREYASKNVLDNWSALLENNVAN